MLPLTPFTFLRGFFGAPSDETSFGELSHCRSPVDGHACLFDEAEARGTCTEPAFSAASATFESGTLADEAAFGIASSAPADDRLGDEARGIDAFGPLSALDDRLGDEARGIDAFGPLSALDDRLGDQARGIGAFGPLFRSSLICSSSSTLCQNITPSVPALDDVSLGDVALPLKPATMLPPAVCELPRDAGGGEASLRCSFFNEAAWAGAFCEVPLDAGGGEASLLFNEAA